MKKRSFVMFFTLLAMGCFLFAAGNKEQETEKGKTLSIHLVFNGIVFDEEWDIYKHAAQVNNVVIKGVASKNDTNATQSYNLMIASGNLPDIIGYTRNDLDKLGAEGGLIALNDLIDKHAPNIKKFIKEHPRMAQDMYSLNGKIYSIPTYYDWENLKVATGLFIRTDWLKKFNLPIPTTVAEYEKALTTFIEKDANGNGKKDEIGLFGRGSAGGIIAAVQYTSQALGARRYDSFYIDEKNKIAFAAFDPVFKQAIATMADWYKKGLVDKELFSRGPSARDQVLPTNLGSSTSDWFASTADYNKLSASIPGFELLPIPPLKDANGKILSKSIGRDTNNNWGWGISSKSKDPVTAIKFMDYWFSDEGRRTWNWGIEGKHYTMVNGKPQFTQYVLNNPDKIPSLQVLYRAGSQIAGIGVLQDYEYELAFANDIAKAGYKLYMTPGYVEDPVPTLQFTPEESTESAKIMAAVTQTTNEYVQKWIMGTSNINADWDTYVARVKQQGIDRAVEIRQKAYERFIAKK